MKKILFSCEQMAGLASQIVAKAPGIESGSIAWRKFKDGWPDLMIENVLEARNKDVAFLASFDTPADVFTQFSVLRALARYGINSLKVFLSYFPPGTMERIDEEGQIATANSLAKILSQIPLCHTGRLARLFIFDIHALPERFYFGDLIMPCLETAIPLLKERLASIFEPAIAFPDEGAWKRFHSQFKGYDQIICQKVRDGKKRIVTIKEGDPRNRHVVIVDDLVQTGGTLEECRKALIAAGASRVSCYITHGVFPEESWRQFCECSHRDQFENIWFTDSCPLSVDAIGEGRPFQVLSLADSITQLILAD